MHNVIDIADNGLLPLSKLVMERNFKKQFDKFINSPTVSVWPFVVPCIEIMEVDITTGTRNVYVDLITRFEDRIAFESYDNIPVDDVPALKETLYQRFLQERGDVYNGIEIKDRRTGMASHEIYDLTRHHVDGLEEKRMKKYIDNETGIMYLLYDGSLDKYGYSVYDEDLLDTYCIRDFVNGLPEISISREDLFDYYLIAL